MFFSPSLRFFSQKHVREKKNLTSFSKKTRKLRDIFVNILLVSTLSSFLITFPVIYPSLKISTPFRSLLRFAERIPSKFIFGNGPPQISAHIRIYPNYQNDHSNRVYRFARSAPRLDRPHFESTATRRWMLWQYCRILMGHFQTELAMENWRTISRAIR